MGISTPEELEILQRAIALCEGESEPGAWPELESLLEKLQAQSERVCGNCKHGDLGGAMFCYVLGAFTPHMDPHCGNEPFGCNRFKAKD